MITLQTLARLFRSGLTRRPLSRSPRYDVGHAEIEAWVGRVLPSRLVRAPRRSSARFRARGFRFSAANAPERR